MRSRRSWGALDWGLVERTFPEDAPFEIKRFAAQIGGAGWCFDTYRVRLLYSVVSKDGRRMVCAYEAPDAEAVRVTQENAGLPYDRIWTGTRLDGSEVRDALEEAQEG